MALYRLFNRPFIVAGLRIDSILLGMRQWLTTLSRSQIHPHAALREPRSLSSSQTKAACSWLPCVAPAKRCSTPGSLA